MYAPLTTDRLVLRPTSEEDADFLLELMNTPKWLEYIGDRNIHTLEDARAYIRERITPQLKRLGHSNHTVIRRKDGTRIGSCGLYDREGLEGVDLGFAFLPQYEGQGYAVEAARAVMNFAAQVLRLERVSAITLPGNTASRKLLEKLGFELKGKTRLPNDEAALLLYQWRPPNDE